MSQTFFANYAEGNSVFVKLHIYFQNCHTTYVTVTCYYCKC